MVVIYRYGCTTGVTLVTLSLILEGHERGGDARYLRIVVNTSTNLDNVGVESDPPNTNTRSGLYVDTDGGSLRGVQAAMSQFPVASRSK